MKIAKLRVRFALTVVLTLAIGLMTVDSASGHLGPIEQRERLEVNVVLDSFTPLDSHDDFLRGATGEMYVEVDYFRQTEHPNYDGIEGNSATVENVADGKTVSLGFGVHTHPQCNPPQTFQVKLTIWEDDTDGEALTAFRALLKGAGAYAFWATPTVAQALFWTIYRAVGLDEVVSDWLKEITEDARAKLTEAASDLLGVEELGELAHDMLVETAAKLAINAALDKTFQRGDVQLRGLAEPIQAQIDSLADKADLSGMVKKIVLSAGSSLLDQAIDFVVDVLAGSGRDEVGTYEGEISAWEKGRLGLPTAKVWTTNARSDDPESKSGAEITFMLLIESNEEEDVMKRRSKCNRPPVALAEIDSVGGKRVDDEQRKEAAVAVDTEVKLTSVNSSDPDHVRGLSRRSLTAPAPLGWESYTATWSLSKPEGSKATLSYKSDDLGIPGNWGVDATFVPDVVREYVVELTVKDSAGASSDNESTVIIRAVPRGSTDLKLTLSISPTDGSVAPATDVTFSAGVFNLGPELAKQVELTFTVGEGLVLAEGSRVTWYVGDIAPHRGWSISIMASMPSDCGESGQVTSEVAAEVSTASTDPNPANNQAAVEIATVCPEETPEEDAGLEIDPEDVITVSPEVTLEDTGLEISPQT